MADNTKQLQLLAHRQRSGYNAAFEGFLRHGERDRSLVRTAIPDVATLSGGDQRALSAISMAGGGVLIGERFETLLRQALDSTDAVRAVATKITTETGGELTLPLAMDDTSNEGSIYPESAARTTITDPAFSAQQNITHLYGSGLLRVSNEWLWDSGLDVEAALAELLARRVARAFGRAATLGAGSVQGVAAHPLLNVGRAGAVGFTTSISLLDLQTLIGSVDGAYRYNAQGEPIGRFMLAGGTLTTIQRLTDSSGRPVAFEPTTNTILGHKFVVNPFFASMAASAYSVAFGDFASHLVLRDVLGGTLVRLDQLYAASGQTAFGVFLRMGLSIITPADNTSAQAPVRFYQNSAT